MIQSSASECVLDCLLAARAQVVIVVIMILSNHDNNNDFGNMIGS